MHRHLWCFLDSISNGVLGFTGFPLSGTHGFFCGAFCLRRTIIRHLAGGFFDCALYLFAGTFDSIFVHVITSWLNVEDLCGANRPRCLRVCGLMAISNFGARREFSAGRAEAKACMQCQQPTAPAAGCRKAYPVLGAIAASTVLRRPRRQSEAYRWNDACCHRWRTCLQHWHRGCLRSLMCLCAVWFLPLRALLCLYLEPYLT